MKKFALFALLCAGCTLIPKYQRPAVPLSKNWPAATPNSSLPTNAIPAADIGWRDFFRDPRLQQLIALALTNNPDLSVAVLTVQQEHDLYRVQRNALIPVGEVAAGATRQRIATGFGGGHFVATFSQFEANLGISQYELDLFGRIRSLTRQALETYFASAEARKSAQILLVSEVSTAYLTARELADQLAVAHDALRAATNAYDLTRRSYDGGVMSELNLNTANVQVQNASNTVAGFEQQLAQENDYLTLLVGRPFPDNLPAPAPFNPRICLAPIPAGLPSDLLERRPDVLEAEHQLKAANANIGAARAAFFPVITLTAAGGSSSSTLSGLFMPGSQAWNISPQLVWPIFAAGTEWDELKAVKIAKRIEIADYQKAVQTAFREVADSLAASATLQAQLAANETALAADQKSLELTRQLFNHGVNSWLNVLAAQQIRDTARLSLIQSEYARLFNSIALYQALGGGWREYSP